MVNSCCYFCFSDGTEGSLVACRDTGCQCHTRTYNTLGKGTKVEGLSPDQPTVTNEKGGKQSDTPYGFNELPPLALFAEAKVLAQGAKKYGSRNWTNIPIEDHLNHALQHIFAYLAGDKSDHHLANLACRSHFALELQEREKQLFDDTKKQPPGMIISVPDNSGTLCITCGNSFNYIRALGHPYECDTCFEKPL
jgi:hypothetical protein